MKHRVRLMVRQTAKRADGVPVVKIGVCFGYWPCLNAPYLQVCIGTKIVELWFGLPSHKQPRPIHDR